MESKNLKSRTKVNKTIEEEKKQKLKKTQEKESLPKKSTSKAIDKNIKMPKTKMQKIKAEHIKLICIVGVLLIILISIVLLTNKKGDNKLENDNNEPNEQINTSEITDNIEIYDVKSNSRPFAVMISNDGTAKKRQYGIQKAYLVYEITVEGGITRLMALFKDVNVEKIGPVRSSRHYYLDYSFESDAIYVHYGWSPQAQSDISNYDVDNLNGLTNPSNMFWRDNQYSSPNNAYTSTDNIKKAANNFKYNITSTDYKLLNFIKEVDLSDDETYKVANNIRINYGGGAYVKYEYNEELKQYLRYNNESKHIDLETNEQVQVKNILVLKMDTQSIENDTAGRQNLLNIGSGDGYYITNGESIEITWYKKDRTSKTIYKNKKGEEIEINDGNTFIQIQPINKSLTIE